MPPPSNLLQIQRLQGKANFLRRFIPHYTELTKGYTRLLKKGVPFHWDQVVQASFDALKDSLIKASLISRSSSTEISTLRSLSQDYHCVRLQPYDLHYVASINRGKYSKWIAILQEFDMEFTKSKSKKSLVFSELLCDLPSSSNDLTSKASIVDESLFLISLSDPWYGDILVYLQTQNLRPNTSLSEHQHTQYQAKEYLIIGNTLYHRGVNTVLRRFLTHEEVKSVLNDCHSGACGGHLSGYAIAKKILRAGYFWPTIFRDYITTVRSCHACHIFDHKTRLPPAPLHPVVVVGPFAKWANDFMTCNPTLAGGHGYIIVVVDYFTKWVEAMPTLNNISEMAALFFFNHVVSRFGVPQAVVTDHGSHFRNHMMVELTAKLGISHDSSTPYYP
eukprot:PITA_08763